MDKSKELKVQTAIDMLKDRMHLVEIKENGHLRVSGCDFWATTEKYYNPKTGEKGNGFRKFLTMIENND